MTSALAPFAPVLAPLVALVAALFARRSQTPGAPVAIAWSYAAGWALALAPLALMVARPDLLTPMRGALAVALAIALLARDPHDLAQTECALKLTWVIGAAFALSWAGDSLLAIAAGTARTREQWPALALALDPYALWSAALALSLLAGLVLLGGAPFHFWPADIAQGARAHLAPLITAALQLAGAAWLVRRLSGIGADPAADALARALLVLAAAVALVGGAATLGAQRRPERRVGTLASLQGALAVASLAADASRTPFAAHGALAAWAGHLALAGAGATLFARLTTAEGTAAERAAPLFRRHPWTGAAASYALLSLAGAPGTPGMGFWLDTARALAVNRHPGLLLVTAGAWLAAFGVAASEVRRAYGAPSEGLPLGNAVPWPLRAAIWTSAGGLVAALWLARAS